MSGVILSTILTSPGTGISTESYKTSELLEDLRSYRKNSEALSGLKNDALQQLNAVFIDNSMHGWDGDDALPVSNKALIIAEDLINIMPTALPLPEIWPDPDGQISFEWRKSKNRVVVITIGETSRLAVAYVNGSDNGYFVERFDGKSVPSQSYRLVREVMIGKHA